jgi:autotransporter-associated beta strand protein
LDLDRGSLKFSANNAIPNKYALVSLATSAGVATGLASYTVASTAALLLGQTFTGTNVPAGSYIFTIDGPTTFTSAVVVGATPVASAATLTFAASGGLTVSPEVLTGDAATVDLNGTTQTINALTATTDGTVVINNTSSSAAAFRFGANDTAVTFGTGTGNYSIQNTGSGKLDIIKAGNTAVSFGASVPVGNKGIIASEGGSFTVAGNVTAASGLSATGNSTLALTGELTNPGLITSVVVSGGSTLSLLNGTGTPLSLTNLSLGVGTGTATLSLNVGESATDTITLLTGGTKTLANTVTINMTDAGLAGSTTYTLLSLVDGGLTAFGAGNIIQGGTPGGFTSMTWAVTDTAVTLTTGTLITGALYWRGTTDLTWNSNLNNWSEDKPGATTPVSSPGAGTNVIFAWNGVGASALTTTLEQNFKINKLVFEAGTTTPASVTINAGAVSTNRLEIAPQVSTDGIEMQSTGPAIVTFGANLRLGANQTWNVASSAGVLTLGGSLLGMANVNLSGAGKVTLSAAADPGFNAGDTATFTVAGGTLELTNAGALGTAAAGNAAALILSGGAFYYNNVVSATLANPITLSGGTLSLGGVAHTYSGPVTVQASTSSTVNLRGQNSAVTSTTQFNMDLLGVVSGTGALTLDSIDAIGSGNQVTGSFYIKNAASTWNGALNVTRGQAYFQNIAGSGTATAYFGFNGIINFNQFGRVTYRNVDGGAFTRTAAINFAAGALGEVAVDNVATTLAANYTLTQSGAVNLNAGSVVRFAIGDAASNIILTGGVVLNGTGSIGVNGGDADSLVTISGTGISGTGNLAINDEALAWTTTSTRLAINVAGTYIGNTTLTEGTLLLGHKDALSSGSLTILGTSTIQPTIDLSGASAFPNATTLAGNLTIAGTNNFTFGALLNQSGGDRTLTNSLTSPAALLIPALNLAETGAAAARILTIAGTGATTITALVNNDQNNTLTNSLTTVTLSIGTIALSEGSATGRTLTLGGAGSTTVTGVISNYSGVGGAAGGLTKTGAGTLTLQGVNTFGGALTVTAGVLEFSTASDSGATSNLGQGSAIALGGTLKFIGSTSQSTNRPISVTAASTLSASGTASSVITYSGAISVSTVDIGLTLAGNATSSGVISGGITMAAGAASADLTVASGTWTITGANSTIADDLLVNAGTVTLQDTVLTLNDDIIVVGAGTVLNLNTTGAWAPVLAAGTSSNIYARGGAVINFNADNVNGVSNANGLDNLLAGDGTNIGIGTFNFNGTTQTIPAVNLGATTDGYSGVLAGPGTLIATYTGTDYASGFRFYRGTVSVNLSGGATILKQGLGDVTLSGDNSGLTGAVAANTRLDAGNFILDYTTSNTTKLPSNRSLDLRGVILTLNGNASAATSQAVAGLTLANGGSNRITIVPGSGQTAVLTLGAITRTAGTGTLRVVLPSGTQDAANGVITTSTASNGTMLGYLTVSDDTGIYFAGKNATNNLIKVASTTKTNVSTWTSVDNVDNAAGAFTGSVAALTSVNTLTFASASDNTVTIASGATLNIVSGGVLVTSAVSAGTHTITGGLLSSGIADLVFTHEGAAILNVASTIGSNHAITKTGNGTLRLTNAANTFTGVVNVQAGTLQAAGGNAIGDTSLVTLSDDQASTFQLINHETIGGLTGGNATSGIIVGTVALGSNNLTIGLSAGTYAGVFTGSGTLTRNGVSAGNNMSLTGASGAGFTGAIVVNGGLLMLESAGTLDAASLTVNKGGTFLISNNGTTRSGTRLPDTMPITLNSADGSWGGTTLPSGLVIRTDQAATTNETVGVLTLASGASYFRGDASGTSGVAGIITSNFVRLNNATLAARARNLGATTGDRNFLRIASATANETAFALTLVGGAGAAATKTISIVPWVIGQTQDASITDPIMGNSLVTYVVSASTGAGLRPLSLTTEYWTFGTKLGVTDNIRESLTASLTGLPGTTINALVLNNSNTAAGSLSVTGAGAGQTLAVTSGTMLFTATAAVTSTPAMGITLDGFDGGITVGSTNEYVVFVQNPTSAVAGGSVTATISSPLTSTADITKSGRGTLVLTVANTAGGGANKATLNEGTLQIDALDKIGGTTGGLVFAGGTLKFGGVFDPSTRTISFLNGGGTFDTNSNDISLASSLGSGTGNFAKIGAGALTLNAASTLTGATSISAGTLTLGANNAIGSGALTVTSGTLALGVTSQTVGAVSITAASTITGGSLTGAAYAVSLTTGTATVSANLLVNGSAGLTKSGAGTLALTGVNTYTGTTEIAAGTVAVSGSGTLGSGSALLMSGGTLTLGSTSQTVGAVSITAATTISGGSLTGTAYAVSLTTGLATVSANLLVNGSAGLTKSGAGTLALDGTNTYAGVTTVSGGALQISTSGALGSAAGNTVVETGAALRLALGSFSLGENLTLSGTGTGAAGSTYGALLLNFNTGVFPLSGVVTLSGGAVINTYASGSSTVTFAQGIQGTGGLTLSASAANNGGAVYTLNGASGYTGDTTLSTINASAADGVTVKNGVNNALPVTTVLRLLATSGTATIGKYQLNGFNQEVAGLEGAVAANTLNSIVGGSATLSTLTVNNSGDYTFAGRLGNVGTDENNLAVIKSGVGSLTLTGDNTLTGGTTISAGTVRAGHANAFGNLAASTLALNGGTLTSDDATARTFANNVTVGGNVTLGATTTNTGTLTFNGTVGLGAATRTLTVNSAVTLAGIISGASDVGLTKNGNGTLTLSAANTYTGATSISGGILATSGDARLSTTSGVTIGSSTTLSLGGDETINSLTNSGTVTIASGKTLTTGSTAYTLTGTVTGGGGLAKAGAGALTITGDNAFTGGTTISAGTVRAGHANAFGNLANDALALNGGTLTSDDTTARAFTNNVTVGGNIALGATTTNTGVLTFNGTVALGAAVRTLTVNSDVTFAGIISNGGLTKIGAGTLTLSGNNDFTLGTTITNGTIAVSDFGNGSTASPLGITDLTEPANLVISGGATLEFTGAAGAVTSRSFTLTDSAVIATGAGAGALNFTTNSTIDLTGNNSALRLTANNAPGNINIFRSEPLAADTEAGRAIDTLTVDGVGQWVIGGTANRFKNSTTFSISAGTTLGFESGSIGYSASSLINVGDNTVLRWSGVNTDDISGRLRIDTGDTAKLDIGSNNVVFASAPKDAAGAAITSGTIEKQGAGTLQVTFSSPNLAFNVPTGKLTVNGTVGAVSLASSGTILGGSGTVGDVTMVNGAEISPGNSPGTLNMASLTVAANNIINWQVQDALAPGIYDQIIITGNLDLNAIDSSNKRIVIKVASLVGDVSAAGYGVDQGAPLNFNNADTPGMMPRTFDFMRVNGAITYNSTTGSNITDYFSFDLTDFQYTNGGTNNLGLWSVSSEVRSGDTYIMITAVPEPSTYGFGLGALALAAAAIRRRRKNQPKA